jgi:hypothetical protein
MFCLSRILAAILGRQNSRKEGFDELAFLVTRYPGVNFCAGHRVREFACSVRAALLHGDTSDYHLTKELCRGINRREKVTSYGVERFDRKRSCRVLLRGWMAG